jgi:hypothetical protein
LSRKEHIHLEKLGKLGQKTQNTKCNRETKRKPKNMENKEQSPRMKEKTIYETKKKSLKTNRT